MKKSRLLFVLTLLLASGFSTLALALPDALFSPAKNLLSIPFVDYQGQSYQAELSYTAPDLLTLQNLSPNTGEPEAGRIVPIDKDFSFHLSQLRAFGDNYQLDASYQGGKTFKISHIDTALATTVARNEFSTPHFAGSGNCRGCHNGLKDNTGKDVSIITAWESTMMANSSRDPFWKAQVKSELLRTPRQAALINDRCTRCHAPMANDEAKKHNVAFTLFDDGILNPNHIGFALAQDGVSCTLCHQIANSPNLGTLAGSSGQYEIDGSQTGEKRKIFGPYEQVMVEPMQQFVKFTPTYSPHIKASEHCGTCHDLKTPYTDANGTALSSDKASEFPEQMAYSEWKHSEFANSKSCQQCHMQRANGVVIASQIPGLSKRDDFAQHRIVGGNKLMLSILQDNSALLGVNAKDFSLVLKETDVLMQGAATLKINKARISNAGLGFEVNINSNTGHKLPSSYPSRRLILHVVVKDAQQNIVFESGKVNRDGSVVDCDADRDRKLAEPHYDLISKQDQVQIYEDVMEDYQGKITYTLLRAKSYRKDNRLLPLGFNKSTASSDIEVRGEANNDPDFIGGSDTVHFQLAGLTAANYAISAELVYQTLGYAFAQDLFADATAEAKQLKQMFNAAALKSYPLTQATAGISR